MTTDWERIGRLAGGPVSNVPKWILLAVAVVTFAMLGWMTGLTYKEAPPLDWSRGNSPSDQCTLS